uniref:Uncharacterized protein n=1 Tax=Kalanchoe fedtschenkoi TaxID=63787 RepID=A0A7N0T876_KALFE
MYAVSRYSYILGIVFVKPVHGSFQYASVEKANEIKEFFANRTIPSIVKSINQSIDQIYVNVKWAESIQHDRRKLVKVFRSCHSTSVKPLGVSPE